MLCLGWIDGGAGMTENEKLIKSYADAIDCLKKNKPTSGYYMLQESVDMAVNALEEIEQYRAIGTVGECRAAAEKQKAKRPDGGRDIDGNDYLICPNCCAIVADGEWTANFCPDCGQKLDWSDEE